MNLLLITFALRNKNTDYESFFVELRGNSVNWWHFIAQSAVVSTYLDADTFAKKLTQHIETTDSLLVVRPSVFCYLLTSDATSGRPE